MDPLGGKYAHQSSYCYADCNPVMRSDPGGMGTDGEDGKGSKNGNNSAKPKYSWSKGNLPNAPNTYSLRASKTTNTTAPQNVNGPSDNSTILSNEKTQGSGKAGSSGQKEQLSAEGSGSPIEDKGFFNQIGDNLINIPKGIYNYCETVCKVIDELWNQEEHFTENERLEITVRSSGSSILNPIIEGGLKIAEGKTGEGAADIVTGGGLLYLGTRGQPSSSSIAKSEIATTATNMVDDLAPGARGARITPQQVRYNQLALPPSSQPPMLMLPPATLNQAATTGLTNPQLVQRAASFADDFVPFTKNAGVTGTLKHEAATTLLKRYQNIYGYRGLDFKVRRSGSILDVLDNANGIIYDWKFGFQGGKTIQQLNNSSQMIRYQNIFGLPTKVIRP